MGRDHEVPLGRSTKQPAHLPHAPQGRLVILHQLQTFLKARGNPEKEGNPLPAGRATVVTRQVLFLAHGSRACARDDVRSTWDPHSLQAALRPRHLKVIQTLRK